MKQVIPGPDTPRMAQFRMIVRGRLAKASHRADETAGPTVLAQVAPWAVGMSGLCGWAARIRREEMLRAGFTKNAKGFYVKP